jgi:hypothetical protein
MLHQALELREVLEYCSPLGPVLRAIRLSKARNGVRSVGVRTIRRLEAAGIQSVAELLNLDEAALRARGVQASYAKQIADYSRRRRS